jgi:hypothetical protein
MNHSPLDFLIYFPTPRGSRTPGPISSRLGEIGGAQKRGKKTDLIESLLCAWLSVNPKCHPQCYPVLSNYRRKN